MLRLAGSLADKAIQAVSGPTVQPSRESRALVLYHEAPNAPPGRLCLRSDYQVPPRVAQWIEQRPKALTRREMAGQLQAEFLASGRMCISQSDAYRVLDQAEVTPQSPAEPVELRLEQ